MVFTGEKRCQAVKSNYYLQFNKVTALFLAMKESEKSSGVQPSARLSLHAICTFLSLGVSECVTKLTSRYLDSHLP